VYQCALVLEGGVPVDGDGGNRSGRFVPHVVATSVDAVCPVNGASDTEKHAEAAMPITVHATARRRVAMPVSAATDVPRSVVVVAREARIDRSRVGEKSVRGSVASHECARCSSSLPPRP
jgi:hypothetical protein